MKLICSSRFLRNYTKPAKLLIVRVLLVCFCLASYLASASDDTASIDHIKGTLDILNEYIQADQMQFLQGWKTAELAALADVVPVQYQNRVVTALTGTDMDGVSQNPYHNTNAYLEALLQAFTVQFLTTIIPFPTRFLIICPKCVITLHPCTFSSRLIDLPPLLLLRIFLPEILGGL